MTRRLTFMLAGVSGSTMPWLPLFFILSIANLSFDGFVPGLIRQLPIMIGVGMLAGIVASYRNWHGCLAPIMTPKFRPN